MVTLASKGGNVISERPKGVSLHTFYLNESGGAYPGAVVTAIGETDPDHCLTDGADDEFSGIVVERKDGTAQDPDTVVPDNTPFIAAPRGCGAVVWVRTVTSRGAILPGNVVIHGGDGQCGGTLAANITTNNFTSFEDSWLAIIGVAVDYDADVAATDYIRVRLCK
jgi:hypothetical protein